MRGEKGGRGEEELRRRDFEGGKGGRIQGQGEGAERVIYIEKEGRGRRRERE